MQQISQIKPVLRSKLQIMIASLELRVRLNHQVMDSLVNLSSVYATATETKPQSDLSSVQQQITKLEAVVEECRNAIQKLRLLQSALPKIDCRAALRLYQDFSELSLAEFQHSISFELRQAEKYTTS